MFFNSVEEINRFSKGMWLSNRLVIKGISNIHWEKLTFPKLWFCKFKKFGHQISFWGAPTHADITELTSFLF